jgi:hypothetical protein
MFISRVLQVSCLLLSLGQASLTRAADAADCAQSLRYTFSWSLDTACGDALSPRGGTSKGAPLTLDPEPHAGWLALREPGLGKHEQDRRAILAMAGPFRTSFEFLETVGYTPDFERARPYQSWGTEYIYVVEEREDFIQLQHIMVMFVAMDDGKIMGPIVQKHWRQDWQYEKPEMLVYAGNSEWEHVAVAPEQAEGSWAQSVYQVDDSPRYEAKGKWQHYADFSTWLSDTTWRPLPRRESSVRDDYQVLEGTNRHTIIHNGWVQEEENYKVALDSSGARVAEQPYLAKELGVNRYERIKDFDFSAGDRYWTQTGPFWADVRQVWQDYFDAQPELTIVEEVNGAPLFAVLFEQAETLTANASYDSAAARERVRAILADYIE